MKKHSYILSLLLLGATATYAQQEANYQVIPLPHSITLSESQSPFLLSEDTHIHYPSRNKAMKRNAQFLSDYIAQATAMEVDITTRDRSKESNIYLTLDSSIENPEGYTLSVTEQGVTIAGKSEAGVFYGIQTLRKSLPLGSTSEVELPAVQIEDEPSFAYRGTMLDVGRHFMNIEEVKTFIDMMVLHNVNTFHWHLTEDQGWRLEIKKYPLLTEIGSIRKETVIKKNTGKYDGIPHAGFYTQKEAKEIVAYAAERYITVIPEIDMPGHMQAALAAYPNLGCTGGPYEVVTQWGVIKEVLCAGNPQTMEFVKDVLLEVMEIFPSHLIHIGGDECPKERWEECPKCQAKIAQEGFASTEESTAEHLLQSSFIKEMSQFLQAHNRQLVGWDEILEGGLDKDAIVMSWRGIKGGIAAAKLGNHVIMTPNSHMYFDYYQGDPKSEPFAIGGNVPLEKVLSYNPFPEELTPEEQSLIMGVQANIWTEYMPNFKHVQYMSLPRMAAMCEVQWRSDEAKSYKEFLSRLTQLIPLYDALNYHYATSAFQEEK